MPCKGVAISGLGRLGVDKCGTGRFHTFAIMAAGTGWELHEFQAPVREVKKENDLERWTKSQVCTVLAGY